MILGNPLERVETNMNKSSFATILLLTLFVIAVFLDIRLVCIIILALVSLSSLCAFIIFIILGLNHLFSYIFNEESWLTKLDDGGKSRKPKKQNHLKMRNKLYDSF